MSDAKFALCVREGSFLPELTIPAVALGGGALVAVPLGALKNSGASS